MGHFNLNLYKHPSGVAFDPRKVIEKARTFFPEATIHSGDRAQEEVQRAEAFLADDLRKDPHGPASKVVASLRRKAKSYGPSYGFTIPLEDGEAIRGVARSVGVGFLFKEPLPEEMRRRLTAFLKSLGVGYLEAPKEGSRTYQILDDLNGPSDCLRDEPGVPWMRPSEPVASEAS